MMRFYILLITFTFLNLDVAMERFSARRKRDALSDQLSNIIQKITDFLNNNPLATNTVSGKTQQLPTAQNLGLCQKRPSFCDYVSCLAYNFQASGQANVLKQGAVLMLDPELRCSKNLLILAEFCASPPDVHLRCVCENFNVCIDQFKVEYNSIKGAPYGVTLKQKQD